MNLDDDKITLDDIWIIFLFFIFVIGGIYILSLLVYDEPDPVEETSIIQTLSFEERVTHDIDVKFTEWEVKQLVTVSEETEEEPETEMEYLIEVTESDIDLMARVVMSEASVLNNKAKYAIACTIVNRVRSKRFANTVEGVVYKKNAYSTQNNGKPNQKCYDAVYKALSEVEYPEDMYYFRMGHYHKFGTPYAEIDGCYFSTQ